MDLDFQSSLGQIEKFNSKSEFIYIYKFEKFFQTGEKTNKETERGGGEEMIHFSVSRFYLLFINVLHKNKWVTFTLMVLRDTFTFEKYAQFCEIDRLFLVD